MSYLRLLILAVLASALPLAAQSGEGDLRGVADEVAAFRAASEVRGGPARQIADAADTLRARWQRTLSAESPTDPEDGLLRGLLLEMLAQAEALEACPAARADEPGPVGAACYEGLLRVVTTVPLTPRQVSEIGVAMRVELEDTIAALVSRHLGVATSVEARARLIDDERYRYPSREAMYEASLAYLERARAAMPRVARVVPDDSLELVRVPEEPGRDIAAAAFYNGARDDRPARFFLNVMQADSRPRATAATAAFHEGWPGHHFQAARHRGLEPLHPAVRGMGSIAFTEGWGLYAERLADELDLYETPEERIGYLLHMQDAMVALQVDAGLHAFGWTREQAVDTMVHVGGRPRAQAEQYADRHLATPGQMVSYLIGYREIVLLREESRRALGDAFDVRDFHEALLAPGPLPLPLLAASVRGWIEEHR